MRGHMNANIARLQSEFRLQKVQVIADSSLTEDCIRLGESDCVCVND